MARVSPKLIVSLAGLFLVPVVVTACRQQPHVDKKAALSPVLPEVPLISEDEKKRFAGSKACRACHAEQFRDHMLTTHADTLHRIEPGSKLASFFDSRQQVNDSSQGITYSVGLRGGRPYFRALNLKDGSTEEASPVYAIGSGRMGYTFLLQRDERFYESRLSYFTKPEKWSWTAGQKRADPGQPPLGRLMDVQRTQECFLCHSTAVVHREGMVQPLKSLFNVGCERCHGPGRDHVTSATHGKPAPLGARYGEVGGETVVKLCGSCHAQPVGMSRDPQSDGSLPRFAATALVQSKCFTKSGGRLSCTSCHAPHQTVKTDVQSYEKVCKGCHTQPQPDGVCPIDPTSGCIGCHMPKQAAGLPFDIRFHNHWIKTKYPRVISVE